MDPTVAFAVVLFLLANGLLVTHAMSWHAARSAELDEDEHSFRWHQFRRRTMASIVLSSVGVMIYGSTLLIHPIARVSYWLVVTGLVIVLMGIAVKDARATARHLATLRRSQQAEHAKLLSEIHELQSRAGSE